MKNLKLLIALAVVLGALVGCGPKEETPTTAEGTTQTGAVTPGKDNNQGGAQAISDAVPAPPGVKTGTP